MDTLLVVGVRPGNLGWHVARQAEEAGWKVDRVDHSPQMSTGVMPLDVCVVNDVENFWEHAPDYRAVVYAAGVNLETSIMDEDWRQLMARQMAVNFAGALEMLNQWLQFPVGQPRRSFVTIASNSAYIPRSHSMSYCASKAALVMAMRCAAREMAVRLPGTFPAIYTYSPGWLIGTPMSEAVRQRIPLGHPLHRIPGLQGGVSTTSLAEVVVRNLGLEDCRFLNGTDIRLDGGEI